MAAISPAWILEHGGRTTWLDELYVLPEYREAGIDSDLIEKTLEKARKVGCQAVDPEVEQDHPRAENLYRMFGFQHLERSRWVRILLQKDGVPSRAQVLETVQTSFIPTSIPRLANSAMKISGS